MGEPGSVSVLIAQAQAGDALALGALVKRYWPFLMVVAGENMPVTFRRAADEEDIVEQAFVDFSFGLLEGSWHSLRSRQEFVALVTTIARRKALNYCKHEARLKRGGADRSAALDAEESEAALLDAGLSPAEQVQEDEWCRHCLDHLGDDLRPVAELLLGGWKKKDIAERLGCTGRTVSRKIVLIQKKWQALCDALEPPASRPA
jgi:RNA polymerase sigma factor (sigma-70 family)